MNDNNFYHGKAVYIINSAKELHIIRTLVLYIIIEKAYTHFV